MVLAISLVLAAVGSFVRSAVPRISEETVQTAVWTAIQRETPDQFLVVGTLDMTTVTRTDRVTRLLPGLLDLETGRTTTRMRVPGRVSYGFNLRALQPRDIRYLPEGVVVVTLPPLAVSSVEPVLEDIQVEIDRDRWQSLMPGFDEGTFRAALGPVRPALRARAEAYVAEAEPPKRNAARAVERMIAAPLAAAGVRDARFRFVVAPGDTLEGGSGDR